MALAMKRQSHEYHGRAPSAPTHEIDCPEVVNTRVITSAAPTVASNCCATSVGTGMDTRSGAKYAPSMITEPKLNRIRPPQRMKCCPRERARRGAKGPRKTPSSRLATSNLAKLAVLFASVDNFSP